MKELINYQNTLLKTVNDKFVRYLHGRIAWDQQMISIKGPRGTGKTYLMLQRLKYDLDRHKALYVNTEHPWFLSHSLLETAETFYRLGGRFLLIDEIHKYGSWSRELKLIYDGLPDLSVVFSSSSALDIFRGESDLSRRVLPYELPGLSFREYLEFNHKLYFDKISINKLFDNHGMIATDITSSTSILPLFYEYLKTGYYPIFKRTTPSLYPTYIINTINTVLEQDILLSENLTAGAIHKLKKLLGIIAESAPFEPNISSIARKSGSSRNTVIEFLNMLERARLINFLSRRQHGISYLQKPDKIYIENTNLSYSLHYSPNTGTLRETYTMCMLSNAKISVRYPKNADFYIDDKYLLEVGGKNKTVKNKNIYIAADNIEVGFDKTIPLWLFGFLY